MKFYEAPKERDGKQAEQEEHQEEDNSDDDDSTATEPCTSEEEDGSENKTSFDVSDHEKTDSLNNKSEDKASYVNPLFSPKIGNQDITSLSSLFEKSYRWSLSEAENNKINRQKDQEAKNAVDENPPAHVYFGQNEGEFLDILTDQEVTAYLVNSEKIIMPTHFAYYNNL